jgi:hypothetical protein
MAYADYVVVGTLTREPDKPDALDVELLEVEHRRHLRSESAKLEPVATPPAKASRVAAAAPPPAASPAASAAPSPVAPTAASTPPPPELASRTPVAPASAAARPVSASTPASAEEDRPERLPAAPAPFPDPVALGGRGRGVGLGLGVAAALASMAAAFIENRELVASRARLLAVPPGDTASWDREFAHAARIERARTLWWAVAIGSTGATVAYGLMAGPSHDDRAVSQAAISLPKHWTLALNPAAPGVLLRRAF